MAVLARTADHVASAVQACARHGVPFVARGSGTGLSGGAVPHADGVLVVLSQMRDVLEVDVESERAVVEPGVINLALSQQTAPLGYYYAPDPSSQQICSIGGNVAENSGGAHCLKYGFTTHHVTGVELVTPAGELVALGGKAPDSPGYDLLSTIVGSEGTLGVVTQATVRLTRLPQEVRTLLAGFASTDEAGAATSAIIGAGSAARGDRDDGCAGDRGRRGGGALRLSARAPGRCSSSSSTARRPPWPGSSTRWCATAGSRAPSRSGWPPTTTSARVIWKGRKSAFAAVGRISPDYIVQDGVIPRTRAAAGAARHRSTLGRARRAGRQRVPRRRRQPAPAGALRRQRGGEAERAEAVSGAILDLCIAAGGSITGEHGVGSDKAPYMPRMFTDDDLDTMQMVRCAFDPGGSSNPGKVFPTPRLCGERPGVGPAQHPVQRPAWREVF